MPGDPMSWQEDNTVTAGERLARVETQLSGISSALTSQGALISQLSSTIHGRPSWPVSLALTILCSSNGILATALIMRIATK